MKDFKKGLIYAGILAFCIGFGAYIYCNSIKKKIPDKLYIYKQDKAVFSMDIPVVGTVYDSSNNICADNIDFGKQVTIQSGNTGQYYVDYKLFGLLSVARTHMEVVDENTFILVVFRSEYILNVMEYMLLIQKQYAHMMGRMLFLPKERLIKVII